MRRHVVRPWSFEDLAQLKALARQLPTRELAFSLEPSPAAITSKARELKVSLKMEKVRKDRPADQ
jgi:hypothetical protein